MSHKYEKIEPPRRHDATEGKPGKHWAVPWTKRALDSIRCPTAASWRRGGSLLLYRFSTVVRPIATFALLAALTGCHFPFTRAEPVQHEILSAHTSPHAITLRRVAVLPFAHADGVGRSARVMDQGMTAALRELGLHEVLSVSLAQCEKLLPRDVIQSNRIGTDELLALRDALHCDGVVVGRIEQFDGYDPLAMGVTAALVSCLDGTVAWSATAHIDSRRKDVQEDIQAWYTRTAGSGNESIAGWRLTLKSPQLFTRYCAEKLALSIPLPVAKR